MDGHKAHARDHQHKARLGKRDVVAVHHSYHHHSLCVVGDSHRLEAGHEHEQLVESAGDTDLVHGGRSTRGVAGYGDGIHHDEASSHEVEEDRDDRCSSHQVEVHRSRDEVAGSEIGSGHAVVVGHEESRIEAASS